MNPLSQMVMMRFVNMTLWAIGLTLSVLYYLHRWPVEGWIDWCLAIPLGILMAYLIILDLIPSLIIKVLDAIQNRVGYSEKFEE
jgi:hypothetical protein